MCQILKSAWLKTVTPENIINGFKKAGVSHTVQVPYHSPKPRQVMEVMKRTVMVVVGIILERVVKLECHMVEKEKWR